MAIRCCWVKLGVERRVVSVRVVRQAAVKLFPSFSWQSGRSLWPSGPTRATRLRRSSGAGGHAVLLLRHALSCRRRAVCACTHHRASSFFFFENPAHRMHARKLHFSANWRRAQDKSKAPGHGASHCSNSGASQDAVFFTPWTPLIHQHHFFPVRRCAPTDGAALRQTPWLQRNGNCSNQVGPRQPSCAPFRL